MPDDAPDPSGDYTAYVADVRRAHAVFENMRTAALLELQAAHEADQAHATTPESIAFGAGRLALIAVVLKARAVEPDVELDADAARHALERTAHKIAEDINARIEDPTRLVSAEIEADYRTMNTSALTVLRQAFVLDRDQLTADHTVPTRAFCQSRIELIDRILEERGVK
jgi:hypothetical protein